MSFFSEMRSALDALSDMVGEDAEATTIPVLVGQLDDDTLVSFIAGATALVRGGESARIAASGVVASRSTRDAGHGGLAQKRGHRSPVSLIQDLTGTTRAEATKQVRLGETLAAGLADVPADVSADAGAASPCHESERPWHAVLGDALMTGRLASAQHDAIYRGLGEPPASVDPEAADARQGDAGRPGPQAQEARTLRSLTDALHLHSRSDTTHRTTHRSNVS
jgi:hypothetical protein